MSPPGSRRRRRRGRGGAERATTTDQGAERAAQRVAAPLPEWRWRTFPVYFALVLGLFLGFYIGLIAPALNDTGQLIVNIVLAILLGLGLSRLTTRWMIRRRIRRSRR